MSAKLSLQHHRPSVPAFDLTNFCSNCDAYVEVSPSGARCAFCGSDAISSLPPSTDAKLRPLVAFVRESREAA